MSRSYGHGRGTSHLDKVQQFVVYLYEHIRSHFQPFGRSKGCIQGEEYPGDAVDVHQVLLQVE